jgi:hypothetical protein
MFFSFRRLPRRCPREGKISYPTELDAKLSMANQAQYVLRAKNPIRAYECPRGGHWHTTSKPLIERKPR